MLEVQLLGKFRAQVDGRPADLPLRAAQSLFAYLILTAGTAHRREQLAGLLWPEMEEAHAKANLRHVLWRVRKALGEGNYLRADDLTVGFEAGSAYSLDANVIAAKAAPDASADELIQIVSAYAGELLPGFYDEWVVLERERLQAAFEHKMTLLLDRLLEAQCWDDALEWGERWIALGHAPEAAYRALINAHGSRGDASGAAAAYRRCEAALRKELGVEPSPQTRAAYERVLQRRPATEAALIPVQTVRGYELRERLGAGAYGAVYRAYQPSVERSVAIKVIAPEYANQPDFIRRFETEARLVARLEHPHIVPLYDYWREPDGAYLVMRWLRGGNLREALSRRRWSPEMAVRLLDQIAGALTVAHRQGIVHRDVKPENIVLDEEGNAYLTDFGLAKVLARADPADDGSATYTSPEQKQGGPATPQSDIYSLGAILREFLAGTSLPAKAAGVIARAAHSEPGQRYPSALAFAEAYRRAVSGEAPITDEGAVPELVNPYKGLRAFEEADAADFFGRAALVQRWLGRLHSPDTGARFLAVVGPSGSGKSSTVKAGLLPALRRGALPGSERWFVVEMTPGAHPLDELEIGLLRIAAARPLGLMEQLRRDERGLMRAARLALPADEGTLLLVIDQFEEVFTRANRAEADQFLSRLYASVMDERSPVRVVITLRADFYDRPLLHPEFSELMRQHTDVVTPMTADEIAQAVHGPAERAGAEVEPDLIAAVVADVVDQPGSLPMLQYALTETFERREDHCLTLNAYHLIGGVSGALARRADEVYAALGPDEQAAARQMFLRLVTLGEGVEDTRRRALISEFQSLTSAPGAMEAMLNAFGRPRLLTFDRDPATRAPTVELAHEALLREWGRLRGWLDEGRADLRLQRVLANNAAEWEAGGRDASFLLRGTRLQQIAEWAQTTTLALTVEEHAYLEASLAENERRESEEAERQRRELETARQLAQTERARADEQAQSMLRVRQRNRLIAAAGSIALMLALLAGIFSLQSNANAGEARKNLGAARVANTQSASNAAEAQAHFATAQAEAVARATAQAETETQRQEALKQAAVGIAAQAILELGGTSPERAVLLALEALENYPYVPQAESALARAVQEVAPYREFTDEHVNSWSNPNVAWSPDGRWLATASIDIAPGNYEGAIWDAASGQVKAPLAIDLEYLLGGAEGCIPANIVWSPNSQQVAVFVAGGKDPADSTRFWDQCNRIEIFDGASGDLLRRFKTPGQFAGDWSPDGRWLLTGGRDGVVRLWDAETGALKQEWLGHEVMVNTAAFSPGGTMIATGAADGIWRLWDATTGQRLGNYGKAAALTPGNYQPWVDGVLDLVWSPDGNYLAISMVNREILLWDVVLQANAITLIGLPNKAVSIAWSPNGKYLAAGLGDSYTYVWAINNPTPLRLAYSGGFGVSPGSGAPVVWAAWSSDSQQLAVGKNTGLHVWDLSVLPPVLAAGPQDGSFTAMWSPDGRWLAGSQYIYDAANDYAARPWLQVPERGVVGYMAAWLPDSRSFLFALAVAQPPWHGIVDASTGQALREFEAAQTGGRYFHFAASPDGQVVASAGLNSDKYEMVMWDPRSGRELARTELLECFPYRPRFSPDSQYVAAGCEFGPVNSPLRIWEARTGKLVQQLDSDIGVTHPGVWSPDGRRLAVGYASGVIRLYDAQTWELERTLTTPANLIQDLHWSPNGQRLVGFGIGVQFVLNVADGAVVMQLANDGDGYGDVSPDGRFISIGHLGPEAILIRRMWQTTDDLIAYARQHFIWRELTPDERQQFGLPPKP